MPPLKTLKQRLAVAASLAIAISLGIAHPNYSQVAEIEPNNDFWQAQEVPFPVSNVTVQGALLGQDDNAEYFRFPDLNGRGFDSFVGVARSALDPVDLDMVLGLFDSSGNLDETVDNGPGGERIYGHIPIDGEVNLGVTGYEGGGSFLNNQSTHTQFGAYSLDFFLVNSIVPPTQPLDLVRTIPFPSPDGIAYDPGSESLWVVEGSGPWDVVQLTPNGDEIGGFPSNDLYKPRGISSLPNGNLLIADRNPNGGLDRVREFSPAGDLVFEGIAFETALTHGVAYDPVTGTVFGLEPTHFRIREFNASGEELSRIDYSKILVGQLDWAQGFAMDPSGNFWIAGEDSDNGAGGLALIGRHDGELISRIDLQDRFGDDFEDPEGLAFHPDTNELYVAMDRSGNIGVLQLPSIPGDFDYNEERNVRDIDSLTREIDTGFSHDGYDINGDDVVNNEDRRFWVTDLAQTYFGDANLDGKVDAQDLNALAVNWQLSDATSWAQGDFNGDEKVDAADLNSLAINWQSGVASAASVQGVPEPSGVAILLMAGVALLTRCRRRST